MTEGLPAGSTRTNIESEIDTLYNLGARRFIFAILPTKIPQFAGVGRRLNPELAKIPDEERAKHPDIRIANSMWGTFFDEVRANPAKYGFTDTTSHSAERALRNKQVKTCSSPDTHFFYHDGHPSTPVHQAVGDLLYQEATTNAP